MKRELIENLAVDFASPVPVYEQIKRRIKQAIARRALETEEVLPSIRELAAFLKINPNTAARAYRELSQEGIISGRAGKGFWVKESENPSDDNRDMIRELFLDFIHKAVDMGFSRGDLETMVREFFKEEQP